MPNYTQVWTKNCTAKGCTAFIDDEWTYCSQHLWMENGIDFVGEGSFTPCSCCQGVDEMLYSAYFVTEIIRKLTGQ